VAAYGWIVGCVAALFLSACGRRRTTATNDASEGSDAATENVPSNRTLALNDRLACAIVREGEVWCSDAGADVERVQALPPILEIAASNTVILGRTATGQVWSIWPHVEPLDLPHARRIAGGYERACALLADESIWCDLDLAHSGKPLRFWPMQGTKATDVTVGGDLVCLTIDKGGAQCVGRAPRDVLADGPFAADEPSVAPRLAQAVNLVLFASSWCARYADGHVACSTPFALPNVTVASVPMRRTLPVGTQPLWLEVGQAPAWAIRHAFLPEESGDLIEIASASTLAWARRRDGTIVSWGRAEDGATTPQTVKDLYDVTAIASSPDAACAVRRDRTVWCWGWGVFRTSRPTRLADIDDATGVAVTTDAACVTRKGRATWCRRSLADGTRQDVELGEVANAVEIAAGDRHFCARDDAGEVWCWSFVDPTPDPHDSAPQPAALATLLGDVTSSPSYVAGAVTHVQGVRAKSIAATTDRSCVVQLDGTVWCWGGSRLDLDGKAGPSPRRIAGLANIRRFVLGTVQCAQTLSDQWLCEEYTTFVTSHPSAVHIVATDPPPPKPPRGFHPGLYVWTPFRVSLAGATDVTLSGQYCTLSKASVFACNGVTIASEVRDVTSAGVPCVLHLDGTVACWGSNGLGQLGDGKAPKTLAFQAPT